MPCEDCFNAGLFEGKRLCAAQDVLPGKKPFVSIIISVHNNGMYLEKCLGSALCQSLQAIEILVVNDASTDNTAAICRKFAAGDKRFRFLELPTNMSQHMGRKLGVEQAAGKYIMFMDADDYLHPDACRTAYEAISSGYDCVEYGVNVVNLGNYPPFHIAKLEKHYNSAPEDDQIGRHKILEEMFMRKRLTANVWNKIVRADICKIAFVEMESGYFPGAQDLYEAIAMVARMEKTKKIRAKLYYHGVGFGLSNPLNTQMNFRYYELPGDVMRPISRLCRETGITLFLPAIEDLVLGWSLEKWLNYLPAAYFFDYMRLMGMQYGVSRLIDGLLERQYESIWLIVERMQKNFVARPQGKKNQEKTLVILWPQCSRLNDVALLHNLNAEFAHLGISVTWIISANAAEAIAAGEAGIYFFSPLDAQDKHLLSARLKSLYAALRAANPGYALYIGSPGLAAAWDLLVLNFFNMPILLDFPDDFDLCFNRGMPGDMQRNMALASCADSLLCHSRVTESWFRINGMDACDAGLFPACAKASGSTRKIFIWDIFANGQSDIEPYLKLLAVLVARNEAGMNFLVDCTAGDKAKQLQILINRHGLEKYCTIYDLNADLPAALENSDMVFSFLRHPQKAAILFRAISQKLPALLSERIRDCLGDFPGIDWFDDKNKSTLPAHVNSVLSIVFPDSGIIDDGSITKAYAQAVAARLEQTGKESPWRAADARLYENLLRAAGGA